MTEGPKNMLSPTKDETSTMICKEQEESEEFFISPQGKKSLRTSAQEFYREHIRHLPGVEAILCETLSDITHFMTILSTRDVETREKIYSVEMQMFDVYTNDQLTFSVSYLHHPENLYMFIKNKNVLFLKQTVYGK